MTKQRRENSFFLNASSAKPQTNAEFSRHDLAAIHDGAKLREWPVQVSEMDNCHQLLPNDQRLLRDHSSACFGQVSRLGFDDRPLHIC